MRNHRNALGKVIASITLEEEKCIVEFDDGTGLVLQDTPQCCETRYMRSDDDPLHFVGARLLGVELRDVSTGDSKHWGDPHEIQFLAIKTDRGDFVIANHNEHNGFYGGFDIEVRAF